MANLQDYAKQIEGKTCKWDKTPLEPVVEYWEHAGGYNVEGFEEKQWLYTECPKCEYQWALHKLGIKNQ